MTETSLANLPHILVVDDDERLRALLKQYLGENGFFVSTAANAKEAEEILAVIAADGLVLDVMMPGETGVEFAKRLKQAGGMPPILLLTARGEADDRIAGLEAGAADYLAKPFAPRELLLRLENMLARVGSGSVMPKPMVSFGDYRFDLAHGRQGIPGRCNGTHHPPRRSRENRVLGMEPPKGCESAAGSHHPQAVFQAQALVQAQGLAHLA
jgi:DNA-binding response OmpR family regulator